MRPIKILSILTITILAIATSSCKQASTETDNSLSSYEHKQNESFMLVKNASGEFCRASVENVNLVSSELLKPAQEATKSPEAKMAEQEMAQLDMNEVLICDQDTISAVKQVTTGESLVAAHPVVVGLGAGAVAYGLCQVTAVVADAATHYPMPYGLAGGEGWNEGWNVVCNYLGGMSGASATLFEIIGP